MRRPILVPATPPSQSKVTKQTDEGLTWGTVLCDPGVPVAAAVAEAELEPPNSNMPLDELELVVLAVAVEEVGVVDVGELVCLATSSKPVAAAQGPIVLTGPTDVTTDTPASWE